MAKTKEKREDEKVPDKEQLALLVEARTRFRRAVAADQHNRTACLDDLRFLNGENQWDERIKKERTDDGRPCLVWNRLATFIDRVVGDQRQNRPSAKVHPTSVQGSKEGARIREGLIRNIEAVSFADIAYDTAFQQAVSGGLAGHIRITTEFEDDETFNQGIRIRAVRNQFSVVWDPSSQEWDKSDAHYVFVWSRLSKDVFRELYPNHEPSDFQVKEGAGEGWYTEDSVTVAEYFKKVRTGKTIYELADGRVVDQPMKGDEVKRTREVGAYKIMRYLLCGHAVLEDAKLWPSRYWPLVPVEGKELVIDEKRYVRGLVRNAKDASKAYNYSRNSEIEMFALAPKAPFIGSPKMFEGHEAKWALASKKTYPYLLANADPKFPGQLPKREDPPAMSTAITASTAQAAEEQKFLTGIFDASLGARGNETSGRGIVARQMEGGLANYVFIDNLIRAIVQVYKVILDLCPRIYDTQRIVHIMGLDGSLEAITLNRPFRNDEGQDVILNDMTAGKYEVAVTVGPSYSTQRMEAADKMLQLIQAWPQAASAIGDLLAEVQDWPGSQRIAKRLRAAVPRHFLTRQELEDLPQGPQPPPLPPALQAKLAVEQMKVEKMALDLEKKKLELGQANDMFLQKIIAMMDQKIAALSMGAAGIRPGMDASGAAAPGAAPPGAVPAAPPGPGMM